MKEFLTTMSWTSPSTMGIIAGVVVLVAIAGYLYWAWSEKSWPFDQ
ncbi:MAG: hypothetical protein KAI16_00770 [Candidatus Pacebacteria bacterium]|nr:hypothetical protein [Candidatus Paceibacterota bacterium]